MAVTPGYKLGPLAVAMALGFTASGHAAKPQQPQPWPCMIMFDNTLLDPNGPTTPIPTAVQSDGGGPYVNGSQSVGCRVDTGTGNPLSGRVYMQIDSGSTRYLLLPGQTAVNVYSRSSFPTLQVRAPGYFEVWDIHTVTVIGQTVRRLVRIGLNDGTGTNLRGDSSSTDPMFVGGSSAWVTRLTPCTWRVVWYPWAPLEAGEYAYPPSYPSVPRVVTNIQPPYGHVDQARLADFTFPLSATVTLIGGAVPGCN